MNLSDFKNLKHRKPRSNRESKLQIACVKWFRYSYPRLRLLLFSVPNGVELQGDGKRRAQQAERLKAEGMTPGAADLFLSVPSGDFPGLYIEMKTRAKGSAQSERQAEFEKAVLEQGYGYAMPRSLDEFIRVVKSYLETGTY